MLWIDRKWYYDTSLEENECMALPFLICLAMYCGYRMFPSANELYRMFLSANELQPPLVLKPILTFPKGRNKLLWFCQRQWDASYPWIRQAIDNYQASSNRCICPSPSGEVRWGLMLIFYVIFLSFISIINFVAYPGFCLKIISRIIS